MIEVPQGAEVSAAALREAHHVPISALAALLGLLREAALAVPDPGLLTAIDDVWPGLLHDADDLDLAAWAGCAIVAGRVAALGAGVAEDEREASRLPGVMLEARDWLAAAHRESEGIADHARSVGEAFATATEHVSEALVALFSAVSRIAEEWPAEIMGEDIPDVIGRLLRGDPPASTDWMRAHVLPRGAEMVERLGLARQRFEEAREHGTATIRAALLVSPSGSAGPLAAVPAPAAPAPTVPAPATPSPDMAAPSGEEPFDARRSILDLPGPASQPAKPVPDEPVPDQHVPREQALAESPGTAGGRATAAGASARALSADEQLAEDAGPAGLLSRSSEFGSRRRAR